MTANKSVTELINNTPLLELKKFDTGKCRLFMKIEGDNPGGSIKDRMAVSMIDAAERDGKLKNTERLFVSRLAEQKAQERIDTAT